MCVVPLWDEQWKLGWAKGPQAEGTFAEQRSCDMASNSPQTAAHVYRLELIRKAKNTNGGMLFPVPIYDSIVAREK